MSTLSLSDYPEEGTRAAFRVLSRVVEILAGCTKEPGGYCIIGGWIPFLLCSEHASLGRHAGSMDVDILLIPESLRLRTPDALGKALAKAGFEPERGQVLPARANLASAKWWARNEAPGTDVRIDFMAPAADRGSSLSETFAADLKLLRFYGTMAARHAPVTLDLPTKGAGTARPFPAANGGAAVMAKAIAYEARRGEAERGKGSKDAYDLYYLLTAYRDGPARLVDEFLANPEDALRREALGILESDFTSPRGTGTRLACEFVAVPGRAQGGLAEQVAGQFSAFLRVVREKQTGS